MQRRRIQTAGQGPSAGGNRQVVSSGQSRDAVQKNHHILFVLHQTLCPLDDHLGYPLVVLGQLVEGGIDNLHILALDGLLDIGNLLRPLIDQQNDQMHVRMGYRDGARDLLQKRRLSGFGLGDNHASLSFSDGGNQIHDPHGHRTARPLQSDALIRENRRQIFEIFPSGGLLRAITVDIFDKQQRGKLIGGIVALCPSLDNVARLQIELADLRGGYVHIVLPGQIILASDKSEPILHNLENPVGLPGILQGNRRRGFSLTLMSGILPLIVGSAVLLMALRAALMMLLSLGALPGLPVLLPCFPAASSSSFASIASTRFAFFIPEVPLMPLDFANSRSTLTDKLSYFSRIQLSLSICLPNITPYLWCSGSFCSRKPSPHGKFV